MYKNTLSAATERSVACAKIGNKMEGDDPFTAERMRAVANDRITQLREQEEREQREYAHGEWLKIQKQVIDQAAKGGFSIQHGPMKTVNIERLRGLGFTLTIVGEAWRIAWQ